MESASTRSAENNLGEQAKTPLQRYISNAVKATDFEPNLALDFEVADHIKLKKGSVPREAAWAIVRHINSKREKVSLFALTLLDICVKNCGFPFHLHVCNTDFLNRLVKDFQKPPRLETSLVEQRILAAIEEWKQTIYENPRYKKYEKYLLPVKRMHRLLNDNGYTFPKIDATVMNLSDNLQSAAEMEEEDKEAQSALLQELIRRGGPDDLQEANRLMKVMAGYDTEDKTDYRAKAAEEVGKIQQKAKIFEERLQSFRSGDSIAEGENLEDLANALRSAQLRIHRMCVEESDDSEAVAKLLEINDSIHRSIERYELVKKGDLDAASKISKSTLGTSTGVSKITDNELSLIDFDGDPGPKVGASASQNAGVQQTGESLEDDLLGLSFQDMDYGQSGGIALGDGANTNVPGPSLLSSSTQQNSARAPTPSTTPQQPQNPVISKPNYDPFAALSGSHASSRSTTPAPSLLQSQRSAQFPRSQPSQPPTDPFAILSSPAPRQPSPSPSSNPPLSPRASIFNFAPSSQPSHPPQIQRTPPEHGNGTSAEDDWDFTSALVDKTLPKTNELTVSKTSVSISFKLSRPVNKDSVIEIVAHFSNNTAALITEYAFEIAVSKGFTLRVTPQSGRTLQPQQKDAITIPIEIQGVAQGQAYAVKMRWKASYKVAGDARQEQGDVPTLGIV
ncbi:hypothetical protein MMC07_004465 [Pseudocyphellaria aurata]|nr:hypothetical protein [Pseudocyphellaria aurata]